MDVMRLEKKKLHCKTLSVEVWRQFCHGVCHSEHHTLSDIHSEAAKAVDRKQPNGMRATWYLIATVLQAALFIKWVARGQHIQRKYASVVFYTFLLCHSHPCCVVSWLRVTEGQDVVLSPSPVFSFPNPGTNYEETIIYFL